MKTGFIGAGKVGCSLGRYFTEKGRGLGLSVEGYFSRSVESAKEAARFTDSKPYESIEGLRSEGCLGPGSSTGLRSAALLSGLILFYLLSGCPACDITYHGRYAQFEISRYCRCQTQGAYRKTYYRHYVKYLCLSHLLSYRLSISFPGTAWSHISRSPAPWTG